MITVDEMKELLATEFGITSHEQLVIALKKQGGVNIAIFTQRPDYQNEECH